MEAISQSLVANPLELSVLNLSKVIIHIRVGIRLRLGYLKGLVIMYFNWSKSSVNVCLGNDMPGLE
jgi:hypothetical protein